MSGPVVTGRPGLSEPAVSPRGTRRGRGRSSRLGLVVVALLAVGVSVFSLVLYSSDSLEGLTTENAGLAGTFVDAPAVVRLAFYLHVVTASVALVAGVPQFVRRLRDRRPAVHRWTGRVYLATVGLGALSALVIAPFSDAGLVALFGFGALAVLWLWASARALTAIRRGDVASHQAWMIRSYALTFAAPMLRVWLGLLIGLQVPFAGPEPDVEALFANAYAAVPFLCWLPNVVVGEWLVRRRGLPSYRLA